MDSSGVLPAQMADAMRSKHGRLLIVEDQEGIRTQLRWGLGEWFEVALAGNPDEARQAIRQERFDAVTLDLGLPPDPEGSAEGLRLLEEFLTADPSMKVIVLTGNTDHANAVRAVQLGAYDYCLKPASLEELSHILERACRLSRLDRETLGPTPEPAPPAATIIGEHPSMQQIFETIRRVSRTDVAVLTTGESGTGKELVARAIHAASPRRGRPFVAINCGAIPENLVESELFGHEKGSFTGAHVQRKGRLELADGGTVFLDEITEMPPASQVKLLRFLQEREIERVGGRERLPVDVRVIAACNVEPGAALTAGKLREDLFYRLSVVTIALPALRERGDDIIRLANAFLVRFEREHGVGPKRFSQDALKAMASHDWPGNVRELENRVRRAVIMTTSRSIGPDDLDLKLLPAAGKPLQAERDRVEREMVVEALKRAGGNISQAARQVGISRPALYDLMRKHRIERESFAQTTVRHAS